MSNIFDIAQGDRRPTQGRRKVVITCAVTGSAHTPSMSEYLPVTPAQIAAQAIEAARAGAAVLHLHARNPDGSPTPDPAVFREFVPQIAAETDAILNFTTGGGGAPMTLEERLAYPLKARPELCSLNMGSMNFAFHKAARGVVGWKHAWEKPYVEGSDDRVFKNTFRDIKAILGELGDQRGARFEFECYDVGHLHNLAHCVEEGLVRGPLFIQCALGVLGGLGPEPESLFLMRSAADRLFGRRNYEFSVLGAGRHQMSLVTMGAIMGGHVRVGLEDSLFLSRGLLAPSCAAQVLKIRRILEELSLDIATPAEAREILQTKGADKVNFHD
ncbi:uncharacterized protein (DUF849 family) [Roseiarcus fermentans]|uniref:Uncharacterized protein (DUF849 family) n=1 Tax=Roseiarcus fermentans TaxID=1473586 RepID=A0A366F333_9HYPH|nr:3-keto-5-aminohexanoate cleavage protein [Roseiarcus fermentans]RBP08159.1 uncharacterized protein (DUF849 family) [Roseiarcus fermentans]